MRRSTRQNPQFSQPTLEGLTLERQLQLVEEEARAAVHCWLPLFIQVARTASLARISSIFPFFTVVLSVFGATKYFLGPHATPLVNTIAS